jgi:hypothetical protein
MQGAIVTLVCLSGLPTLAHGATFTRYWSEIDGLRVSNATVITKNGERHRGHLVVTTIGATIIQHGTYEKWLSATHAPEIPKAMVARIEVRHRYRLTGDEERDLWWYVAGNWKAIFHPELSNLFPIAIVAHAGFTGWAAVYSPVASVSALCFPTRSDTIEILPDGGP